MSEGLALAMAGCLVIGILSGYPVAFLLGGLGVIFVFVGGLPTYVLQASVSRIFGIISNWLLLSIPLFVFMGLMLDRSGVARRLLYSLERFFGRLNGGLAVSVTLLGIVMAASTGIVGASVIMLGALGLPVMLREKYDPHLAVGVVAASGTLGILIPPSIMLVMLGAMMQISVGDLFKAALVPGILLGLLYVLYTLAYGLIAPSRVPAIARSVRPEGTAAAVAFVRDLAGPVSLIALVLGSIIAGVATPTEAAALGAAGATLLAILNRELTWAGLKSAVLETGRLTGMIMFVSISATVFSGTFKEIGGNRLIEDAIASTALGPNGIILLFMAIIFVLGCFLEWIEITFIVLPLFLPVLAGLNLGPDLQGDRLLVWFAILTAVNLQTSFLTPPFGFSLFYVKGVAPPEITLGVIYRSIIPFVLLQLLGLSLVFLFPGVSLGLLD